MIIINILLNIIISTSIITILWLLGFPIIDTVNQTFIIKNFVIMVLINLLYNLNTKIWI